MELTYAGLRLSIPDDVYEPSEDSFMLARAASSLRGRILEIGTGSGLSCLCAARADPANRVLGADINPSSIRCATENAKLNGIKNVRFLLSDLFSQIQEKDFDAIILNPPYLPTSERERIHGELDHAFNGGEDGREMVDRFLSVFDLYLRPGGTLLLVQSSLNDPEKTMDALKKLGYETRIIAEEKFFFEKLFLLHAAKP